MARRAQRGQQPLLELLTSRFPDYSRDELYRYVMCSEVHVDGHAVTDPRRPVSPSAELQIVTRRFVSRGGEKLAAALETWNVDLRNRVVLDAGASTGGFTDCVLQHGARCVHAVDVGYNQLDYRLRQDERVVVHERTNAGDLRPDQLEPRPDLLVCDLSFRSLRGILRPLLELTIEGWGIALLKPQFEVAAEARWQRADADAAILDQGAGVVAGRARDEVIDRVCRELEERDRVLIRQRLDSPVPGRDGNREVLLQVALAEGQLRKSPGASGSPT